MNNLSWFNFKTGEYEELDGFPQTDAKAADFIPQDPSAQGLYQVLREMGNDIATAMRETLEACAGVK